jgi:hypothetical protein
MSRLPVALLYILRSLWMYPFSLYERLFLRKKILNTSIPKAPVFIIGHYRSGTTYLHKLIVTDRRWGYISAFNFLFPYCPICLEKFWKSSLAWISKSFHIKHLHFHDYLFDLDDPVEEDMFTIGSIMPHSAFLGEILPRNALQHLYKQVIFKTEDEKESWKEAYLYTLRKITYRNHGKPLILKNPPNTGRIPAILEIFPDAKFILIHRNPYQVYYSTLNLWKNVLEKYYALHKINDHERDEIIFSNYNLLMSQYLKDKMMIPDGNLVEIRYDHLKEDPLRQIRKVYDELKLFDFESVKYDLIKEIEREKGYTTYRYTYDNKIQDRIFAHWKTFIERWNYRRIPVKA